MLASQEEAENVDETNAKDKKKLKAVKRNDEAMASLTLAFTTNDLLNKIISAQTADWPEGLASLVVKELYNKHNSTDTMSLADKKITLSAASIRENVDPKKMFKRLKSAEVRFNTPTHKIIKHLWVVPFVHSAASQLCNSGYNYFFLLDLFSIFL